MFLTPRIRLRPLAELCRRLATQTSAGIQDRSIWSGEAQRGSRSQRAGVQRVSQELARGRAIDDALASTGDYFPVLFRQMVAVGDASGKLDRTYRRLAEHYEHMLTARRMLIGALIWPGIQLAVAVLTIGVVIWFSSFMNLKNLDGTPLDMFGLGLTGSSGLTIYFMVIVTAAILVMLFVQAWSRGMLWTRSLQRALLKVPGIGNAIQTLALARFTWAMQLVLDTSMDLRKALPLALDATGNDTYRQLGPRVADNITRGLTLKAALEETGAFPRDLLEAIAVGEQTGMLAETMQRESAEYQRRSAAAIAALAWILGGLIWLAVAALIITLIFRLYGQHIDQINELADPNFKV